MNSGINCFREALRSGKRLYGLWLGTASGYLAQLAACAGYDWYLVDGEHAPNTISTITEQICALQAYGANAIVRPLSKTKCFIKQIVDIGAKTILVPMVDTVEQAREVIDACKYPPVGNRAVGIYVIRASRWGEDQQYFTNANEGIFLITQCESEICLNNLDKILALKEIEAIFIGPSDLSASLGFESRARISFKRFGWTP